MKPGSIALALFASMMLVACAGLPTAPIDGDTLVLPAGSRLLVGRIEMEGFAFRLGPFSPLPRLPEKIRILSPASPLEGLKVPDMVRQTLLTQPADMVLLVQAIPRVEKGYNPRQVFAGWHTEPVFDGHVDGKAVYRMRDTPEFRTEYGNRCTRISYRVYQFGPDAGAMGRTDIAPQVRAPCPEQSDSDLSLDEKDPLILWLEEKIRLSASGP